LASLSSNPALYRFGSYEFEPRTGELRKQGIRIRFDGQPVAILLMLLNRPGELVTREELQKKLWPADTFVDFEHSLNAAVKRLRSALNDSADTPRFIETVPRRGYRFLVPVEGALPASAPDSANQDAASANQEATDLMVEKPAAEVPSPSGARTQRRTIWLAFIACAFLVAFLVGFNVGGLRQRFWGSPDPSGIRSLAVLPLENLSHDPEQEYFADGMTEALTTELAQISALKVISRTSAMQYKGTKKSLPQIAQELGVDAVVEGAVQRSGDKVGITVQLIHAPSDRHLLAKSYERDLRDVLALQREIAHTITDEIKAKLTPQEQARLTTVRPVNPEAYDAYLRGSYYQGKRTEKGLKSSVEYFEQAVAKDPASALAYSGLADSYSLLGNHGFLSPQQASPKAEAAALKALAMDDTLAEAHTALAFVKTNYDWDFSTAEREFNRAIELNPGYPRAHSSYAAYLGGQGRIDEALAEIKRALELDPLSVYYNTNLGWYLHKARRYDQAISQFQLTLEMDPNRLQAHLWLGQVYESKEMYGDAIAEFQKAIGVDGGSPPSLAALAHAYAVSGKRGHALRLLSRLKELELSKQEYVSAYDLAVIYTGLGEKDQALKSLERAYEQRDGWIALWLKTDARLDPLRADQRFASLLRRIGLPQ
jgi:TolB-like protein/DNA-binding winged helix-turn-helix (wHTH) protein/Tfp pilus assembly protein PilF